MCPTTVEFFVHSDAGVPDDARSTNGPSVDGKGTFSVREAEPLGGPLPELAPAEERPERHSVVEPGQGGFMRTAKDAVTP
jgi:hypothetical protein